MQPFERLAMEIVLQAIKDYRKARVALKRNPFNLLAIKHLGEVESFLRSTWFEELTNIDPEVIIQQIEREIA